MHLWLVRLVPQGRVPKVPLPARPGPGAKPAATGPGQAAAPTRRAAAGRRARLPRRRSRCGRDGHVVRAPQVGAQPGRLRKPAVGRRPPEVAPVQRARSAARRGVGLRSGVDLPPRLHQGRPCVRRALWLLGRRRRPARIACLASRSYIVLKCGRARYTTSLISFSGAPARPVLRPHLRQDSCHSENFVAASSAGLIRHGPPFGDHASSSCRFATTVGRQTPGSQTDICSCTDICS